MKESFQCLLIATLATYRFLQCKNRAHIAEEKLSSLEIRERWEGRGRVAGVSGYTYIISSGTPYTSIVI